MLGIVLVHDHSLPATRRIVAKGNLTERQAADYFRTMVTVAAHCHQLGVMHRWGGLGCSQVGQRGWEAASCLLPPACYCLGYSLMETDVESSMGRLGSELPG